MRNRPKLLHIVSSLQQGGAETVLISLVKSLEDTFDQAVIYFHDGPLRGNLDRMGVPVYHVNGQLFRYDPFFMFRLFCVVHKFKPSVMHTCLWAANLFGRVLGKVLRIPTFCALHAMPVHEGMIRNYFDRYAPIAPAGYIAVSAGVARSAIDLLSLPADRIETVPNGIDVEYLSLSASIDSVTRDQLGCTQDHFIIGSVGRLVPVKNYPALLRSFYELHQKYDHVRLLIVGDGPERENLETQAKELTIKPYVIFVGLQPAVSYYSLFNCFVQSSHCEGMSLALLEALSFSLAAVVTGTNDQHDVIDHEIHGLVVEPNHVSALTGALERLITDRLLCHKLGAAARNHVQTHFSLNAMSTHYRKIFEHAISFKTDSV
jgi:glycosyltransferase involved in cell wall biosynthesis